jgi:helicase MOV-10
MIILIISLVLVSMFRALPRSGRASSKVTVIYLFILSPASFVLGDRILVHPHGSARGKWYEGHVHVVRQLEVGLCFHESFPYSGPHQKHQVQFKLNRMPLRRQHQALDVAFASDRLLFPEQKHVARPIRGTGQLELHNKLIASNPPQMTAVKAIADLRPGSIPFVIFGP